MDDIYLQDNDEIEIHGLLCPRYAHIRREGKRLYLNYHHKNINIEWLYEFLDIHKKEINKKISR
jgi:hypothetical protein